jgi:hypothetical protein
MREFENGISFGVSRTDFKQFDLIWLLSNPIYNALQLRNLIYDCDKNIDTTDALLWHFMFLLPT